MRSLPDVRIDKHLILKAYFVELHLSSPSSVCTKPVWWASKEVWARARLKSSLIPVYSNSCNWTSLRTRCALIWESTLQWSFLWKFVKECLARISRLRTWVHCHFCKKNNPGSTFCSKSYSYSCHLNHAAFHCSTNLSLMLNAFFWNI